MFYATSQTVINKDGLRYKSKPSGPPFGPYEMLTLSCYKCGTHRPRSEGSFLRRLGQSFFACGQCKPLQK